MAGVAPQLTADGAGAAALKAGYGPDAPALLAQRCQRHSVFWLQVFVSRSHLRTLPLVGCCTSDLRPPDLSAAESGAGNGIELRNDLKMGIL
jgi:hypothetical protein